MDLSLSTLAIGKDSSMLIESIVMPRKVHTWPGEVTFFQETSNPRSEIVSVTTWHAAMHSSRVGAITRKSSR